MTNDEAVKEFRRVYPESEIKVGKVIQFDDDNCILSAYFPDGDFYFVITEHTVSHSYDSEDKAIRSIR